MAYFICNQKVTIALQKAYTQQHTQLIQAGYIDPDPRETFVTDLIKQIYQSQQQHYEILLCMDANKNMARLSPTQGIRCLLHDTGLIDLHKQQQPSCPTPSTYNCGATTINTCLGSMLFVQALKAAWYLPFGSLVTLPGNHHLLGLACDMDILFGYKLPNPTAILPCLQQYETTVKRFSKMVIKGFLHHNLFDQIFALAAKPQFTNLPQMTTMPWKQLTYTLPLSLSKQTSNVNALIRLLGHWNYTMHIWYTATGS